MAVGYVQPRKPFTTVQSSVKNFLPGLGNGWLTFLRQSTFLEWAVEHFESDSRNLAEMFYATLYVYYLLRGLTVVILIGGRGHSRLNGPHDGAADLLSRRRGVCSLHRAERHLH